VCQSWLHLALSGLVVPVLTIIALLALGGIVVERRRDPEATVQGAGQGASQASADSNEADGNAPDECADGGDNDRDGAFDCVDSDCSAAPDCDEVSRVRATIAAKASALRNEASDTSASLGHCGSGEPSC